MKHTYEEVKEKLKEKDLYIIDDIEFKSLKQKMLVTNGIYKAYIKLENYIIGNKKEPYWFYRKNPYIIYNLNQYLSIIKNKEIECISSFEDYNTRDTILKFRCKRCGEIINMSLFNAMREDKYDQHKGITCNNCDGTTESLHAIVLKQLFMHYYPDTILEDKSCINPNNGAIMPTDIVNHRMKVAIEIQGQFHENDKQKERDLIKKEFWLSKGYSFYDYSIDKMSVLDYVKLFFNDITEIPDYINLEYSNKLNIKKIQELLNSSYKVMDIAEMLNYSPHRIYDALNSNKLTYPNNYLKSNRKRVIQLNKNKEYVNTYNSYAEAERANNITKGLIASCIYYNRYYSSGYYWIPYDEYVNKTCIIYKNP